LGIDRDIVQTWGAESFNFTKEVWSPFKLEAFSRHFRCFVLVRSEEESFPPSRARVWSFYEHAWHALKLRGVGLFETTIHGRAVEAHTIMQRRVIADADWLGVPVIRYEELFEDHSAVAACLRRAFGDDVSDAVVAEVVATREQFPRLSVNGLAA
jgi:hypothetical protein